MRFKHTDRPGFFFGLIDFCTAIAPMRYFDTLNKIERVMNDHL